MSGYLEHKAAAARTESLQAYAQAQRRARRSNRARRRRIGRRRPRGAIGSPRFA